MDGEQGTDTLNGRPATNSDTPHEATAGRCSDAELIRRIQADDLDAFEALFDRYRTFIYRTAYGLTGDHGAAEEILQDTFVRAHRHRATLRPDVSPVPWLHRVALNLCYSRLGRRRLRTNPIGEIELATLRDAAVGPSELAERKELRQAVREGVAALPPKHQSVVVLYYLHGLSLQETSAILGIRLGTVKSRLHYALGALRAHLASEGRSVEAEAQARAVDAEAEA